MDALFVSWDRDARQRAHGSSGRRPACKAAAGDRIGALVTTRRSLATIAAALLILVAGVALLYALRAQLPPTIVSSTPSPTPTATAATATTTPPDAIASNVVNVCGPLNPYQGASGTRNSVLSMATRNGLMNFELVGSGTVPANLGQDKTLREVLRLTGRRVEGVNALADYNVVRVSSCSP